MEYLWAVIPAYQLSPLDSIQRRATRIVDDPKLTEILDTLGLRRHFVSTFSAVCTMGSVLKNCLVWCLRLPSKTALLAVGLEFMLISWNHFTHV